ncbi:hypothetical protein Lal_00047948 [Lupinus albus]|uniref:Putative rmlC-like jelly roll protein n=1 Tax=Lupinus albus TaxID=3870 RepID=A0A6A4QZH2_LUPAL|nr:putative rmlC-like jelly roll protein [Lupinus albus]KAF1879274.1 hypothetical protein Lal_00047948 [Lupinus albus]
MTISEINGVQIETNPPQSKLDMVGVKNWEVWNSPVAKFTHTFTKGQETVYILEGKFLFTVEGYEETIELGVGDMANFPIDSTVTFDILEPLKAHILIEN